MTITPSRKQELIQELAEQNTERLKTALLGALDDGWMLFAKGKPRERLRSYIANTMTSDVPLVTDPAYLDKLAKGEAPMLLAVQFMQSPRVQSGEFPAPPALWPIVCTQLPGYVFEKLSRDFRDLLRQEGKKDNGSAPEPEMAPQMGGY